MPPQTQTVKFEKDVPPPMNKKRMVTLYRFGEMKVGESFFASGDPTFCGKVAQAARDYAKSHKNYRFQTERREENGVAGVRVWRVAEE